jgi:hypothetical protein
MARAMVGRIRQLAQSLGLNESTQRYHVPRPEAAQDGRRRLASVLDGLSADI